jgi:tetratricopeptide (TPR) repeat protein
MRRDWQIMVLLAAATVAVFWQVSRHEFVNFDDPAYVTYNPMVQQGLTWSGVAWAFGNLHGDTTYWHPVTWLSHMLDCQLFGLKPAGHHLTSLLLHTLNVVMLFVVLRRMTGRRGPSAIVAALFALHPLQVDSVAWIAERKNVLSAFFFLLTLWAYDRYVQCRMEKTQTEHPTSNITDHASRITHHASLFYLLSLLFFACGLMSKPTLVPLPFLLLLLDYWPLGRMQNEECPSSVAALRRVDRMQKANVGSPASPITHHASRITDPASRITLLLEKLPFLALSAASSVVTIRAHEALGALLSTDALPVSARLANAVVACALYLRKLVWPLDLSVFYLHPGSWPDGAVDLSTLLVLGVMAVALWQARRRPYLIVGWLWFLGMLVPVSGLVQAHVQAMADRFAYLPVIGVFVMVVWAAAEAVQSPESKVQSPKSGVLGLESKVSSQRAPTSIQQPAASVTHHASRITHHAPYLSSSVSICGSPLLSCGLAAVVLAGCVVMTSLQLRHWRNSVTLFQQAARVEPDNFMAWLMLGNGFFERREFNSALGAYESAARLRPDYPVAWLREGATLTELGRLADAMPYLTRASQLAPGWPETERRLALALSREGRTNEARQAYQKLEQLMPATAEGQRDLADMLAEGQQYAEAIRCYCEALRLKPDFEAALNNLAMLRASCRQPEIRNGLEAVQLAETACRLSGRRNPSFLGTLAAAYAEAGRFPEAVMTMQQALALAKATGADELIPIQTQMLQQFRAGKPYR